MKTMRVLVGLLVVVGISLGVSPVGAADFSVTIVNTTHGTYFTPLLITAHAETIHLFQAGQPASDDIRAMAEGGDTSGLEASIGGADQDTVVNPAGGLLGPGASVTTDLNTDASGHSVLSLVAMILPTNDGFVGVDSLAIPQDPGTYTYYLNAWDAGTEANDEIVVGGSGGAPGTPGIPADPGGFAGTGGSGVTTTDANTTIHIHRGNLGDDDASGGESDLDITVHRWLNPVAKLIIDVR